MRQVAFNALPTIMVLDDDLLEPRRAGRIGFVASEAIVAGCLIRRDFRVIGMLTAHTVAGLAGKRLVRIRSQLVQDVGVTFIARLLARKYGCPRRNLPQRITAVPTIFSERLRGQKSACHQIRADDEQRQQNQSQNLWWQFEAAHGQNFCCLLLTFLRAAFQITQTAPPRAHPLMDAD